MKKVFLSVVGICLIATLAGCGISKIDKLANKITKEELVFVQSQKNVCDTELTVENKLILKTKKDSQGNYTAEYQYFDCGESAVYMTLSNGTYKKSGKTISFTDQYNQKYTFKVTSEDEVSLVDKNEKVLKKFKLETVTESK